MARRFAAQRDKTIEEILGDDPAYIIWLFEMDGGEFTGITLEQYGAAIEELARREVVVPDTISEHDLGIPTTRGLSDEHPTDS